MKKLQVLLSTLMLAESNMRILHWNTVGYGFDGTHSVTSEYYEKIAGLIDDIAEMVILTGGKPVSYREAINYVEHMEEQFIELHGDEGYNREQTWEIIAGMFATIVKLYEEACDEDGLPDDVESELETSQFWFRKELQYKLARRMVAEH